MTERTPRDILLPMLIRRVSLLLLLVLGGLAVVACDSDSSMTLADPEPTSTGSPGAVEPFRASHLFLKALPVGYRTEILLDGLEVPTSLAATPDGRLLITEQEAGRVRVVQDGRLVDEPWLELSVYFATDQFLQELGLVTIAVDPDFEQNGFVYIYYTVEDTDGRRTVLARLRDIAGRGTELTELLSIDLAPEQTHIAGGIAFDPSGAILLGVGDHEQQELAQQLNSPVGKVLRIDRDGNPLPDNPFVDVDGADPRIYAYGVRNPFGVAVDPDSGRAYITENRAFAGDAVYELEAGANYGWPDEPVVLREPLVIYDIPMGLAGIMFYRGDALPDFTGDLFFCSFHRGGGLHWSETGDLTGFNLANRDRLIAPGCSTGVAEGADGFIYFLSHGEGKLMRISR